jgi:hypothetical protein
MQCAIYELHECKIINYIGSSKLFAYTVIPTWNVVFHNSDSIIGAFVGIPLGLHARHWHMYFV